MQKGTDLKPPDCGRVRDCPLIHLQPLAIYQPFGARVLSWSVPSRWQAFSCHNICTGARTHREMITRLQALLSKHSGPVLILICTYCNRLESDNYN